MLKSQLAYALPFAAAVLVEIVQASLPQYVVSHLFDPATFAIFAVGCLQIPLVDFAASPTSDVMMVKMQERLAEGRKQAVLEIWHDTTWKLALLFFPLVAFCMVAARRDHRLPVYRQVRRQRSDLHGVVHDDPAHDLPGGWRDASLRADPVSAGAQPDAPGDHGGLIQWSLSEFHLVGPVLVIVLATLVFKAAALLRMKTLLEISTANCFRGAISRPCCARRRCAAAVALAVKSQIHVSTVPLLMATAAAFALTYAALVWHFDLLQEDEKLALTGWVRKSDAHYRPHVWISERDSGTTMCGIAGIVSLEGKPVFEQEVRDMCAAIAHRGPDDDGYYFGPGVGLGMRRLSIIDLASGRQPVRNEDGTVWVVFNGEIYNFRELRRDLEGRGHVFYTHTDTETIVHLYEEYGKRCVDHLRGMFALLFGTSEAGSCCSRATGSESSRSTTPRSAAGFSSLPS